MSSPKLRKPERFSTATIVWGIIFLMSLAWLVIAVLSVFLTLFYLSVLICIVSFFGTVISFIIHEERRARYKHALTIRKAEKERAVQQERLQQRKEWEQHHAATYFTIKGVTFTNDDGSSRQKYLKALHDAIAIEDHPEVTFVPCEHDSETAVRVLANGMQIGFIAAHEVEMFLSLLPHIEYSRLDVECFVPDDDTRKIYRADVYVVYSK